MVAILGFDGKTWQYFDMAKFMVYKSNLLKMPNMRCLLGAIKLAKGYEQ
ncbi:hypothetical protein KDD93_05875 [Campylobacter sp. faydin G-24]|uniref:Uncharacterized protein n=1 Tax=Campylobacter anatolicus TaxID=2829105 RepID=A0ABS5HIJ3_9BACT|nr:hypothetical protein [Campylobacter anatolicus]MBR8464099.1 hypothetical protein [Campylobacter anatolicus]MBR8466004.1 hypothetical protein [Campylobacter anatolicus]